MALPTVRGVSAASANGTTTVAPTIPAGTVSGELMLAIMAGSNTGAWSVSNQNGGNWQEVGQAQVGTTTTTANITIFYDYYNGTQGTPTFNTPGNNGVGRIMTITGARAADGATFGGLSADLSDSDGNTAVSLASGFSTSDADCLIVLAAAAADDSPTFGASWTNANLGSITIQASDTTTSGNDSSCEIVTGTLATAGAVGTFANTLTGAVNVAGLVLAIRPPVSGQTANYGVAAETDTALAHGTTKQASYGIASETDAALAFLADRRHLYGIAAEADSGLAFVHSKLAPYGVAAETDAALALIASKLAQYGVAGETDLALLFTGSVGGGAQTAFYGVAGETDAALALVVSKLVEYGVALETDTGLAFTAAAGALAAMYGVAIEDDTAMSHEAFTAKIYEAFEVARGDFGYGKNRRPKRYTRGQGRATR